MGAVCVSEVVTTQHTVSCEEMRTLVSCRLDGAISQFEIALVAAHLRQLSGVRRLRGRGRRVHRVASRLPDRCRFRARSRFPALPYRRHLRVARGAAATAAAAIAAAAIGGSGTLSDSAQVPAPANDAVRTAVPAVVAPRLVSLQELYREDLSQGLIPVLPASQDESLGAVKPVLPAGNV